MNTKTKKKKRAKSEIAFLVTSFIVPIYAFIMFYIVPNAGGFFQAFLNRQGEFTLVNFVRVFNTLKVPGSDLLIGFRNTFLMFGISVLKYPFTILVPFFLYKKVPFFRVHKILFFIPSVVMGIAISLVIGQLMAPTGFIAEWVGKINGLDYAPELYADSRFANKTLILQSLWLGFPGDIIIWLGTFSRIPDEMLEAGRIDGTNWWTEITKIVVPLVWPTVALQMVLMVCGIFNYGTDAFVMTKGEYGTMTFGCWMTLQMLAGRGNSYSSGVFGYMAAVGLCVTLIAVPLGLVVRKLAGKLFTEVEF